MATTYDSTHRDEHPDRLMGTQRAHGIDRWIFVFMAALYILVVLVGFIPDSLMKIEMVKAGLRAPFPPILHVHAVVMGTFLLMFLAQTLFVATGRQALHERMGRPMAGLAALLVVVGFLLAPTMYHQVWGALQVAPPEAREALTGLNRFQDNVLLLQISVGLLFALFIALGLRARHRDPGFHKRMMVLAPAMPLPAAIDRITWIPHTMPQSPLSADLYVLLVLAPLIGWDVLRNGRVHRAYLVFAAAFVPVMLVHQLLWDTPGWHATARAMMGV